MRKDTRFGLVLAAGLVAAVWFGTQSQGDRDLRETPEPSAQVTPEPVSVDVRSHTTSMTATATDTATNSREADGTPVSYEVQRILDGDNQTAWRAPGDGVGEVIEIAFGDPVVLTEVGLIPGYDKVDPTNGVDRFVENRRITAVEWEFSDGTTVYQSFDDSAVLQTTPVYATTDWVRIRILSTTDHGGRDFTPISEVKLFGYVSE